MATEHKREVEKQHKLMKKNKDKSSMINQEFYDEDSNGNINDEFYLENPQVAKTEELLKFLPMVNEKLGVKLEQLPDSTDNNYKDNTTNKKNLSKTSRIGKRGRSKVKILPQLTNSYKKQKVSEDQYEEEKETKEEREGREKDQVPFASPSSIVALNVIDLVSKTPIESVDEDLHQIHKSVEHFKTLEKPCFSVKSHDNLMESFPDDPFQRFYNSHHPRPIEMKFDTSRLDNHNSYDFSNNNYSEECKELEQQLLNE